MKMRRMTLIVSMLTPGMVLCADLRTASGKVLLKEGVALTSDEIAHLGTRGVEIACVWVEDARTPEKITEAQEAARCRLDYIFRMEGSGAYAQRLRQALVDYRQESLA